MSEAGRDPERESEGAEKGGGVVSRAENVSHRQRGELLGRSLPTTRRHGLYDSRGGRLPPVASSYLQSMLPMLREGGRVQTESAKEKETGS